MNHNRHLILLLAAALLANVSSQAEESMDKMWGDATAKSGIEADFGPEHADTFRRDLHPDLRADWQMANAEVRMWN